MKTSFLDFEQPIAELEQKIEELRFVQDDSAVDISQEIERLSKKSRELTKEIYGKLTAWQISKVARHPATAVHARLREPHLHRLRGDAR
jgi:acetyl-CoA carboxylase carboxyl transferase subunit alpha